MTVHTAVELATIIGVVSAVLLAWGTITIRLGRKHIDDRCAETIKDEVAELIGNGVTQRIDRLGIKLDKLYDLVLTREAWDGKERRDNE